MHTQTIQHLQQENERLRNRLQESEETLQAIQAGAVDALVIKGPAGEQIFTLSGEEIIYRRLVETMNEAGLTTTPDGTILFCNKGFSKLVRRPMEQIVGQPLEQFVSPLSRVSLDRLMGDVREHPIRQRLVVAKSDGSSVPVLISASLLCQADSVYVCLVAADLSELEAKNSELKKRADQLSRIVSELTLTEKRERHRLAKVLHDHLQQLLVGAVFGLEALSRQTDEKCTEAVREISGLLQECVEVSRSLTVELSPTILHEAGLEAGLEWLARWMKEKHGLEVELDIRRPVTVDREELRILLFESVRELLFNIVKHAGVKSAGVGVFCSDDHVRIVIRDEGVGFSPCKLGPRTDQTDTGFGLFSIRERLELLGGTMAVETAPNHGAVFTLTAPLQNEKRSASPLAAGPAIAEAPVPSVTTSSKIRVMVADDHTVVRQGLCTLLFCENRIDVVGQARDGQQAVEMARRLRPDVILMDCSMPKLDGLAATKAIRSEMPAVRIIGLSMYQEADRANAMLQAGACAYLDKSGDFRKLVNAICDTRSRPSAPQMCNTLGAQISD
jgi:PAS domain S-box-containing protein